MKHRIRGKNFDQGLESRDCLSHPNGGLVTIDDRRLRVQWHKAQKVAFVQTEGSRLEQVVRFNAIDRESFAGEAESKFQVHAPLAGGAWTWTSFSCVTDAPGQDQRSAANKAAGATVRSPMTGKILQILRKAGESVKEGDLIMIIEAMKMENKILATCSGVINKLNGEVGRIVNTGDTLVVLKSQTT